MKLVTIKFPNGYVGEYVADFKPNDLITAYQKGYHRFVAYEDRGPGTVPLIHYKRAFNFNGKACKSGVIKCDAAYCRPATDHLAKAIADKQAEIKALEAIKAAL